MINKRCYMKQYHSCCFVGIRFEAKPKHCAIRGTMTNTFKGESPGS